MTRHLLRIAGLVVATTLLLSCAAYSPYVDRDVIDPLPQTAPVSTQMTSALVCLREEIQKARPNVALDSWVCPFAADGGMSGDAAWHHVLHAMLKLGSSESGPVTVRNCHTEWPVLMQQPQLFSGVFAQPIAPQLATPSSAPRLSPAATGALVLSGRVSLENDLVAQDVAVSIGWGQRLLRILGVAATERISMLHLALVLNSADRVVYSGSPEVSAIFRSTKEGSFDASVAVVQELGLTAAIGTSRQASKERVLQWLAETSVYLLATSYFDVGTTCMERSGIWERAGNEYRAMSDRERKQVETSLHERRGGRLPIPGVPPAPDLSMQPSEYQMARFTGTVTPEDVARVTGQPVDRDERDVAPTATAGGLRLVGGRLISAVDGYALCWLTDGPAGARIQAVDVIGSENDSRIFHHRTYPIGKPPESRLGYVICFRTPSRAYAELPIDVRNGTDKTMKVADLRALFAKQGLPAAVAEGVLP